MHNTANDDDDDSFWQKWLLIVVTKALPARIQPFATCIGGALRRGLLSNGLSLVLLWLRRKRLAAAALLGIFAVNAATIEKALYVF